MKKSQYDSKKKKKSVERNIERETVRKMINIQNLHYGLNNRSTTPKSPLSSKSRSIPRSSQRNSTPRHGVDFWSSSMPIEHRKAGILMNNTNDTSLKNIEGSSVDRSLSYYNS